MAPHTFADIKKQIGPVYISVPCLAVGGHNIGSCTYSDPCALLGTDNSCPPVFQQNGIPCICPVRCPPFRAFLITRALLTFPPQFAAQTYSLYVSP